MLSQYKVKITEAAQNDLRLIFSYISEQLYAPITATTLIDIYEEKIKGLCDMHFKYPLSSDGNLVRRGYHKLTIKNYIVLFLIDDIIKTVIVARIFHGTRDYNKYI